MKYQYTPFGEEWEKEAMKLPKEELVAMIRKLQTGTDDKKICGIETIEQAQHIIEGIVNDFESGISDKKETLRSLGKYTGRLMELFWNNALAKIKANPELLK